MAQFQTARGADLETPRRIFAPNTTKPQESCGCVWPMPPDLHGPMPDQTVSALDRLIARIETGTATPEDVDDLPDGVVEYLYAVLTLSDMGVLDQDWKVTPTGGILVRNATR